jgi:hypothetical protein
MCRKDSVIIVHFISMLSYCAFHNSSLDFAMSLERVPT